MGAQSCARWLLFLGCVAGLLAAAGIGLIRTHAQESFPLPAINPPGAKASPSATQAPPAAANDNAPEVTQQCADLLRMATELKSAVDKSSASTLSVTVVRKAGEIEQLAHKVRTSPGKN